jgi:hypothetical protein
MAIAKNTWPYPQNITEKDFKAIFVKVTDDNKVKCLAMGRIAYEIVRKDIKTHTIRRILEYSPRLTKGHIEVSDHPIHGTFDFWVFEDQEVTAHRQMLIDCFGATMKSGNLYIKLSEAPVKYSFIKK